MLLGLRCSSVPGEREFSVKTQNIVAETKKVEVVGGKTTPGGTGNSVACSGQASSSGRRRRARGLLSSRHLQDGSGESTEFDVPSNAVEPTEDPVSVVSKTESKNPYAAKPSAAGVGITSVVTSLEFVRIGDDAPIDVKLGVDKPAIRVTIPVTVSGSACRRTVGGCRFFDEDTGKWSTDGLFEVERTDTQIVCEAKHLTSFAISADDAIPSFNIINPITDADLFANVSLQNALVFFVIGAIIGGFGLAAVVAYRRDKLDRERARLEHQFARLDNRITKKPALRGDAETERRRALLSRVRGTVQRTMGGQDPVSAAKNDISTFDQVGRALADQHEIVGLMYCHPNDHFTRPQRLIVLLSLIMGQIAMVAIFFGINPSNLAAKIIVGFATAVALAPSKYAFRFVFQKASYVKRATRELRSTRMAHRPAGRPSAWRVRVKTSDRRGAGTDATVSLTVHGSKGDCGPMFLQASSSDLEFSRASTNDFTLVYPHPGEIRALSIGHDGRGLGSAWHLESVTITSIETGEVWTFTCGKWLALNPKLDDGIRMRTLTDPVRSEDALITAQRAREQGGLDWTGQLVAGERAGGLSTQGLAGPQTSGAASVPPLRHPGALLARRPSAGAGAGADPSGRASSTYLGRVVGGSFVSAANDEDREGPGFADRPRLPMANGGPLAEGFESGTARSNDDRPIVRSSPAPLGLPRARVQALHALGILRSASRRPGDAAEGTGSESRSQGSGSENDEAAVPKRPWRPSTSAGAAAVVPAVAAGLRSLADGEDGDPIADGQDAEAIIDRHARIRRLMGDGAGAGALFGGALEGSTDASLVAAVVVIQRRWRRHEAFRRRRVRAAATTIQRVWRGHLARLQIAAELRERNKGRNLNAGIWFLDAVAPVREPPEAWAGTRTAADKARAAADDEDEDAPADAADAGAPPARLVSLAVRKWVADAPEVAAREGEDVQRQLADVQARKERLQAKRRQQRRQQLRDRRLRRGLPRWVMWPTYVVCFLFVLFSAYICLLYGISFPPAIARGWLLASLFAIFFELFVQDPIRIVAIALITTWFAKARRKREEDQPVEDDDELAGLFRGDAGDPSAPKGRRVRGRGD